MGRLERFLKIVPAGPGLLAHPASHAVANLITVTQILIEHNFQLVLLSFSATLIACGFCSPIKMP